MDPQSVSSTMQSLAFGEAMLAAAKAYKKEMEQEDATGRSGHVHEEVGIDEFLDDPELRRLHEERIASIKEVAERRARKQPLEDSGHGIYSEIKEGEFLTIVTKTERVVCHFFHQGFERCQIMDKHLKALAQKYVQTRFVKLNAPDAPFFTDKLKVKILPCVLFFIDGIATGRIVGFDELGNRDDFSTASLERRLLNANVIMTPEKVGSESDDTDDRNIRRSQLYRQLDSDDESSDFD